MATAKQIAARILLNHLNQLEDEQIERDILATAGKQRAGSKRDETIKAFIDKIANPFRVRLQTIVRATDEATTTPTGVQPWYEEEA